jgi:hypothetical protein
MARRPAPAKKKTPTKSKQQPAPKRTLTKSKQKPAPVRATKRARRAPKPTAKAPPLRLEDHTAFISLTKRLKPGSYAGGLVVITTPGALDDELHDWLMGNVAGRRSIGRTAFGELLVFRDLRGRAREFGVGDPDGESDVALVDVHFKKMTVLGNSVDAFLDSLDDADFQEAFLRRSMFDEVKQRLGPCAPNECYGFVPALSLGGSEHAASVQRVDWRVHQAVLLQT